MFKHLGLPDYSQTHVHVSSCFSLPFPPLLSPPSPPLFSSSFPSQNHPHLNATLGHMTKSHDFTQSDLKKKISLITHHHCAPDDRFRVLLWPQPLFLLLSPRGYPLDGSTPPTKGGATDLCKRDSTCWDRNGLVASFCDSHLHSKASGHGSVTSVCSYSI